MLNNLSFSRFRARLLVVGERSVALPPFAGSAFRGALGHGMRRVRYGRKAGCPTCAVRSECRYQDLYAYMFESPADHPFIMPAAEALGKTAANFPQPFVLEPPEGGEYFAGEMLPLTFTLVGRAVAYLPFFVCALEEMGRGGVGKGRGRVRLVAVTDGDSEPEAGGPVIYNGRTGDFIGPGTVMDLPLVRRWAAGLPRAETNGRSLRVCFLTPFRFKYQDRLGAELTFPIFMRNVFRRLDFLSVHSPLADPIPFGDLLAAAETVETARSRLEWADWQRFSHRQNQRMNLGGMIGDVWFSGDPALFLPYIKMGEYLHAGKAATFGLGRYRAELADPDGDRP